MPGGEGGLYYVPKRWFSESFLYHDMNPWNGTGCPIIYPVRLLMMMIELKILPAEPGLALILPRLQI